MKIEKCFISNKNDHQLQTPFYPYDPTQDNSYLRRYQYVQTQKYQRKKLVEVIKSYHSPELLHPAVEQNLERLQSSDSVVVIGGQQAGILTGPLYTIYKIITIIQLAKREEARLNKPVIPIFWIAGEDHDLQEVDHLYIPKGLTMEKKVFPMHEGMKNSVSSLMLDPATIHEWLKGLHQALSDQEYKPDWVALCEELTREPISWTRFFARLVHYLFAEYGLLLIDSHDPNLRELEQVYFTQMIEQNEALVDAVNRGIQNWESAGLSSPLQFEEQQAHLFMEHQGNRVALYRDGGMFFSRNYFFRFSKEELLANHLLLSNNVATRPLMQEMVFPVLAFVGGPSEVDYWGCLGEAFQTFQLEMPIVYPRQSVTLVERSIEKYRETWGISWETLLSGGGQSVIETWKQENVSPQLKEHFDQFICQFENLYEPFVQQLTQFVDGNMIQLGDSSKRKIMNHFNWLQQKAYGLINNRQEIHLRRHREVIQAIYPLGGLQERTLSLIPFWNAYGLDWLHMLCKQELVEINTHQLLFF